MSRTLLYITPYFSPATKVGALRPLKFVRHLAEHGWRAVVLADLRPTDATHAALWDAVPSDVDVHFRYSAGAGAQLERALRNTGPAPAPKAAPKRKIEAPSWLQWSPEYVPLGEHGPRIPGALRAARELAKRTAFDAVLVNADPYAAMLVGARIAAELGVPVVHDLRDPWSVCDLRRPRRPALQRRLVDRLERSAIEASACTILNTETTLAAYRAHYADLPADRFACIRNHGDASLVEGAPRAVRDPAAPFTILFLGNFRRFLQGDALLGGLAALRDAGFGPDAVRFAVTGHVTDEAREHAARLGVAAYLEARPFVPYVEIGAAMDAADLLIANIPSRMRVPAKLYDYALSRRPILALGDADHTELRSLVDRLPGARFAASTDSTAVATAMRAAVDDGKAVSIDRSETGLDSATATAKLATILNRSVT